MPLARPVRRGLKLAMALSLALTAAGCETLDSFNLDFFNQKKPLPGQRQQVFPEGVPGVDYSSRYQQPSNANTPIDQLNQQPQQGQQGQKPAQ